MISGRKKFVVKPKIRTKINDIYNKIIKILNRFHLLNTIQVKEDQSNHDIKQSAYKVNNRRLNIIYFGTFLEKFVLLL